MLHNKIKKQLSAYLDDELSPRKKKRVEKHLSKCQECSLLLEELREVSENIASLRQTASKDLWYGIKANLGNISTDSEEAIVADKKWKWEIFYPITKPLAAAALILFAVLSIFIGTFLHKEPENITQEYTPIDVYLTAHTQYYSQKPLATEPVIDLVEQQVNTESVQKEQEKEYSSEIDFYVSVYMGEDDI